MLEFLTVDELAAKLVGTTVVKKDILEVGKLATLKAGEWVYARVVLLV